jgi:hypothetical protein
VPHGKAAEGEGKSEDLPWYYTLASADRGKVKDHEDKKGKSPDRINRSGDFFIHGPDKTFFISGQEDII